jgi:hypothetical protein
MRLLRADVKCYLCGYVSGQIEGAPGDAVALEQFRPTPDSGGPRLTHNGRICCTRCGGGVFLDEWETVRPLEVVTFGPAKRGRPRKHPLPQAS